MQVPDSQILDLAALSDPEILRLFDGFGRCSKIAMRRALGLLPEIVKRGLYRKAGFMSPYEFAQKRAGASRYIVERVMRLHQSIGHLPELWGLLVRGEEGWSKLTVIQGLATPENASKLADLVSRSSRAELEEYLHLVKKQQAGIRMRSSEPVVAPPAPQNEIGSSQGATGLPPLLAKPTVPAAPTGLSRPSAPESRGAVDHLLRNRSQPLCRGTRRIEGMADVNRIPSAGPDHWFPDSGIGRATGRRHGLRVSR